MADEFIFSPKVKKLIDEMNLELDDKIKNFPGNIIFHNKLFNIRVMMNLQSEATCEEFIEKAKLYNLENNKHSFDGAIKEYQYCLKPFEDTLRECSKISDIYMKIFREQNSYCFKDCYIKNGENEEIKQCLIDCVNNFEKYTLPAFGNLYSTFLDQINEISMKNI